jgi:hypothetical protein
MDKEMMFTIVELFTSIVVEGIIISFIFNWISTKQQKINEQNLKQEMNNIEQQNKFNFQQLQSEIRVMKTDVLSEIKQNKTR